MKNSPITEHQWFMALALEQAHEAYKIGEVPVGAIIVDQQGSILSKTHNLKESTSNPTGHAELLGVINAAKKINGWRLNGCSLYVTLEPCLMCLGALIQSRIERCVFGAYDLKGGSLSLGYAFHEDKRLNHQISMLGGIKHYECSKILSQFFKERRKNHLFGRRSI